MICSPHHLRFPSPYQAVPVRVPYQFPLTVSVVVEEDADDTESSDDHRQRKTELDGMSGEVESVAGVDGGHPHNAAPALWRTGGEEGETSSAYIDIIQRD